MADEGKAVIVLAAEDRTGPAFQSAQRNLRAMQKEANTLAQKNAQLAFQLNDLFVQIASGGNPLLALVQQGSQLSGTFGGVGNALKAVLATLTPIRLAAGGVAGALGAIGFAALKGAQDTKELANAILLSGNYAGQTAGEFNALVRTIADTSGESVGSIREIGAALIKTGEIGREVFGSATVAAVGYAQATGKSADQVAADFARMAQAPSKFAREANRSLNFLTAAQYDAIKSFEDAGRAADAQGVIYDALNQRFGKLKDNLTSLDRALKTASSAWSNFWDRAFDIGRSQTIDDKIQQTADKLQNLGSSRPRPLIGRGLSGGRRAPVVSEEAFADRLRGQQDDNREQRRFESRAAENASASAEIEKGRIAAIDLVDSLKDQIKGADRVKKEVEKAQRAFAELEGTPQAVPQDVQKAIIADIQKKNSPRTGSRDEAGQVRRAELDQQLKSIHATLQEEQTSVRFNNEFLRSQYQQGEISLRDFYSNQRQSIERGVSAKLEALKEERTAVEKALSQTTDQSERVTLATRRDDIDAEAKQVTADAARDRILLNQDEAKSFRDLTDAVSQFQAQLAAASGQEFTAETAQIETTIQRAQTLATQSGGSITSDQIQTLREQLTIRAQINEAQRNFSTLTSQASNAEERLVIAARAEGKGTLETEQEIRAVRQKALDQLGSLIEQTKTYAANSKDPSVLQFLDDLQARYESLQASVDPTKLRLDAAADNIGDTIADGFARAVVEGGKLSDIVKGIERDILSIVARETITKPIADSISGFIRGAGGQGTGQNLIGQLFGLTPKTGSVKASPLTVGESGGVPDGIGGFLGGLLGGGDQSGITAAFATLTASTTAEAAAKTASTTAATAEATASSAAAASLGGLTLAAQTAAAALASISVSKGGADAASAFLSSGSGGSGFGDFFASFFHSGGVVGEAKDLRRVSFENAPRYHTGGIAGLKADEVPSVLLKGEEVLTQNDPRHRDNLSTKVFERLQSMKEGASLTSLEGFDTKSIASEKLIERMLSEKEADSDAWSEVTRYHTGGIAGLAPDEVPAVLRKGEEVLTEADPRHRDNFGGGQPIEQHFHFKDSKPSRQTLSQVGSEAARGLRNAGRND